jgi:protein-tyrosine-phosphatase/predicted ATP-grasp superfamily ATP-dependent carboligase
MAPGCTMDNARAPNRSAGPPLPLRSDEGPLAGRRPSRSVLVLGSDTRAFLAVIRSLGRRGLSVHVAWCPPDSVALRSRYVRRVHELPFPEAGPQAWIPALSDLLHRENFDLVLPCHDQVQIPLQLHRAAFEPWAPLVLLDDPVFRIVSDKVATSELARSLGIPVPRSLLVRSVEQIPAALDAFDYPLVVKPWASFTQEDLSNRNWVTKARSARSLRERLEALLPRGPVLLQENFVGIGVGVELLAHRGEPLVLFQHERVHEPLEGGGSTYRRSVALHPELRDATARLISSLQYTGIAMVEFKLDPRTGRWVLIEINGRFWGSLPLAIAAGADFPAFLYDLLVDGRREFPTHYREDLYCRNLRSDLRWNWLNLRADRGDPTLHTRPLVAVAKEARSLLTGRERFDTLTRDDPRPGLLELAQLARSLGSGIWLRARRSADSLPGRRAARRSRARATARVAGSLLFVCFGNICRSPFAAERARRLLRPGLRIASSGYYPIAARRSPTEAVHAGLAFGIDLSSHRSTVVDADGMATADLILAFDETNRRELMARFPSARAKIHLLGVFADEPSDAIADPYGGDADRFAETYRRIDRALEGLRDAMDPATGRSALSAGASGPPDSPGASGAGSPGSH